MASSTAPTTMAGSMPFSWLRSSMLWYKTLLAILCLLSRLSPGVRIRSANPRAGSVGFWRRDEARHLLLFQISGLLRHPDKLSDLRHQLSLLDIGEGDFDGTDASLPALAVLLDRVQVERDDLACTGLPAGNKAPLPMAVAADCLEGLHFDQATLKPLKILGPAQLTIQTRRTGLERIFCPWNQIFHIQQHAKIATESGAILVRNAGQLLQTQPALDEPFRKPLNTGCDGCLELCTSLGVFLEKNPQGALLRRANELQVHHVQPMRDGHPCCRRSNFVQLDCHRPFALTSKKPLVGKLYLRRPSAAGFRW